MSSIKVYTNDSSKGPTAVKIHYEFCFYHFVPYVLLAELKDVDELAVGLFVVDKNNLKHSLAKYPDRIYLHVVDNVPIEEARYILNISYGRSILPKYTIHYKELGNFIRSYYWTSVLPTKELPLNDSNMHILVFDSSSVAVDHSIIPEDQT
ncbi:unnamed protein product [Rotaria sp. Silwood1]|nr:unnamed protein product [Rotaria sp. Silwood1]CAF1681464.1 unnamed protein product [Rotaria sp. Silwood1]